MKYKISNPILEREIIHLKTSKDWKLSTIPWEDALRILDKDIDTFMIGMLREKETKIYNIKLKNHPKYNLIKEKFKNRTDDLIDSLETSKPQNNWPNAIIHSIQSGGYAFEKLAKFLQKHPNIKFEHKSHQKNKTQWIIHTPKLHTFKTPNEILKEMIAILGIQSFKKMYKEDYNLKMYNPITSIMKEKEPTLKEFQHWALKGVNLKSLPIPKELFKVQVYKNESPTLTYSKINPTNLLLMGKEDLKIFEDSNILSTLINARNDTWEIIDKQLDNKLNIFKLPFNMLTEFYNSKPKNQQKDLESKKKLHSIIEYIKEENIYFFITEKIDVEDLARCILKRPEIQNLLPIMMLENFENAQKISLKISIKEKINLINPSLEKQSNQITP